MWSSLAATSVIVVVGGHQNRSSKILQSNQSRWIYILKILEHTHAHPEWKKNRELTEKPVAWCHTKNDLWTFDYLQIIWWSTSSLLSSPRVLVVAKMCVYFNALTFLISKDNLRALILMYTCCCLFIIINLTLFINRTHTLKHAK